MDGGKNKTKNCRFEGVEGREKERIIDTEEMKEKQKKEQIRDQFRMDIIPKEIESGCNYRKKAQN